MKLCVIGDPVGHSMSPVLHRRMLALSGIEGDYQAVTVTRRGDELLIEADELQRAVTPGQSVVLYQGDVCLGGGIAEEAWK